MCLFSVQRVKGEGRPTSVTSRISRISNEHDHAPASRLRCVGRLRRRLQTRLTCY